MQSNFKEDSAIQILTKQGAASPLFRLNSAINFSSDEQKSSDE